MKPLDEFAASLELDDSKPWSRRVTVHGGKRVVEHPKAHAAFRVYCELGEQRGLRAVAARIGKSRTLCEKWSRRWRWVERVKAWDDYHQEIQDAAFIRERVVMGRRIARAAMLGQDCATNALQKLNRKLRTSRGLASMTASDIARLLDVSSRLEMMVRGDPDQDQVAKINVIVSMRETPRYNDLEEIEKELDPSKKHRPN